MEANKSGFRASPQEWNKLVEEFASSGMSAAVFCRRREIPIWQMRHRLKRRTESKSRERGFVEIGDPSPTQESGLWVEAGRFRIRIGHGFDPVLLRRVAEALA